VSWLLLALLVVLLPLAVFAVSSLSLWRATKALARQVSASGETVERLTGSLDGARSTGPLGGTPCPTCGAPRSAGLQPSSVSSGAR
jgi:hypothetical protein